MHSPLHSTHRSGDVRGATDCLHPVNKRMRPPRGVVNNRLTVLIGPCFKHSSKRGLLRYPMLSILLVQTLFLVLALPTPPLQSPHLFVDIPSHLAPLTLPVNPVSATNNLPSSLGSGTRLLSLGSRSSSSSGDLSPLSRQNTPDAFDVHNLHTSSRPLATRLQTTPFSLSPSSSMTSSPIGTSGTRGNGGFDMRIDGMQSLFDKQYDAFRQRNVVSHPIRSALSAPRSHPVQGEF